MGRLAAAHVRALQEGKDPAYHKVIAVAKHFLANHLDSHGSDGQYRLSHSFNLTEADIQQTYLPPFAAAVEAGVSSVMCAYDGQVCVREQSARRHVLLLGHAPSAECDEP